MRKATGSRRRGDCTRKSSVERRYLNEVVDAGEFRGLSIIGGAKLVANGSRERLENEIRVRRFADRLPALPSLLSQ